MAVGPAELEVVHHREELLEELLLGDTPADGVGREQTPALATLELIVTVIAAHKLHDVLALVVVVQAADVTGSADVAAAAFVLGGIDIALVQDIVRVQEFV